MRRPEIAGLRAEFVDAARGIIGGISRIMDIYIIVFVNLISYFMNPSLSARRSSAAIREDQPKKSFGRSIRLAPLGAHAIQEYF
jgi:hypothetical protein